MTRDNGGPAFPRPLSNGVLIDHAGKSSQVDVLPQCGMSLRDYFAAKFIEAQVTVTTVGALLSVALESAGVGSAASHQKLGELLTEDQSGCARAAYAWADAMLAERSKP